MEDKTIKVSRSNWKKLYLLKIDNKKEKIDDVITELLKNDKA